MHMLVPLSRRLGAREGPDMHMHIPPFPELTAVNFPEASARRSRGARPGSGGR